MMLLDDQPKRIENREWTPPRKLIGGYIALHGGRLPKSPKDFADCRATMDWVNDRIWGGEEDPTDWLSDEDITALCVPGIYAVARIAEVVTSSDSPWFTGTFGWVLTDFVPITPVPCKGSKNLWPVEDELLAKVRRAWKAARTGTAAPVDEVTPSPAESRPLVATGADLRIPGLFCPGTPLAVLPPDTRQRHGLEQGRLYGLPVAGDWVTVRREGDAYAWCSRRSGGMGQGSRAQFEAWLSSLRAEVAA